MSMPKIPDMDVNIKITREDAVNLLIASVGLEELSLAHILNAEGEKIQYVLGTLDGATPMEEVTICDILEINKSVEKILKDVIKTELLLQFKLEDAIELSETVG